MTRSRPPRFVLHLLLLVAALLMLGSAASAQTMSPSAIVGGAWENDSGGFVLTFSADGRSFKGTWGLDRSKTDGGPWTGKRK